MLKSYSAQKQSLPGYEKKMQPKPQDEDFRHKSSQKLQGKTAIITGGDSGIGKAIAILFAKEGANIVICYLSEDKEAKIVENRIHELGQHCLLIRGDLSQSKHCKKVIQHTLKKFKKIDILINHAGEQYEVKDIKNISEKQLKEVFAVNVFSMFYLTQAALNYMKKGSTIINTVSIVAYRGHATLIDYAASKGACLSFTRALSEALIKKGIRVNGVAPGPIWTPLIPASFSQKKIKNFGKNSPMQRAGEPYEVAPAYLYLACYADSSYVSGQVLHVNGGEIING